MSQIHEQLVAAQFGPRAQAYVESAVHASGPDLAQLDAALRRSPVARALDLGAGGGHVAYLMARFAKNVVACDLSSDMLAAITATAAEKGIGNIETAQALAERTPFGDENFDFVASRYSAHHWRDFPAGLREARRVLKKGGRAVFIDVVSTGQPLNDTHLQAVELLRDPSHVRDYTPSEWFAALDAANFSPGERHNWRIRLDFATWTRRMNTPALQAEAIRALQKAAPDETKAHFAIEADGSFLIDVQMVEAVAA